MRGAAGSGGPGRLRIRRSEGSHSGGGGQPFLRRRTGLQILDIHFLGHFAFIRSLLRQVLRQYQMNRLSEIGNDLGALLQRGTAQACQEEHQRNDSGVYDQRANGRPPIPARVRGLVPVQQKIGTGIRA